MQRIEIHPKLKSSVMYLALGLVLKLVFSAVGGPAQSVSSIIPGVAAGGGLDCPLVWQNSPGAAPVPDRVGAFTFSSANSPADLMVSFSGDSQVSAGVGDACASLSAFTFPLAPAPAPASPELLVAGTLGLMLVGWWKIRTLEL
jgi:hypothetical protein